jgi:hypothetical protein
MAKLLWMVVALFLMSVPAQAQCTDLGPMDVPVGFGTSEALMEESDTTIAFFVMGAVDATPRSAVLGADAGCIKQLALCTEGKNAEALPQRSATVIAIPANRAQPAQQVVFNIVFGDCFRTFKLGEPA